MEKKWEEFYKDFKKYEIVRRSGEYNMLTEADRAAKEAGLSQKKYLNIIHKYSFIKEEIEKVYGSVDEFLKN